MKNIYLIFIILLPLHNEAQVKKRASARDFNTISDYRLFLKHKDSLNKINNTNLEYEYLENFKKIINKRDSIVNIEKVKHQKKIKDEYIYSVELHKYIGTYALGETKDTQFLSYPAKMYVLDTGITILPNNQFNEALRFSYDYSITNLIKNLNYRSGQFYMNLKNGTSVIIIDLENKVAAVSIDKTIYTFGILDFKKFDEKPIN